VVGVPYAGWPLLVLLSPVILVVGRSALSLVVRWLLAGHLVGPGIAEGNADAFRALSRAFAYLRGSPLSSLRRRALGFGLWLYRSLLRIGTSLAVVALAWLVLRDAAARAFLHPGIASGIARVASVMLVLLLGAWLLAVPLGAFFGVRAAVYLLLRRDLDGTPTDARGAALEPEPTLEELGMELVESLRRDAAEGRPPDAEEE
jgi:hypothetical protein